ncbi:AAA family ATPase [Hoeflea sp.]|uniref:AAA family ATPase n=1 Tax=Hoeflea sp. TaxID=1940281 RepID=UPI003748E9A7
MRLNRLDLTRYGKFTDHVIDFGRPSPGSPDLHLVYGPNEAGKSTLFNAWLDLLFGIGTQSSYNFLHPYPTMQIGAAVEVENGTREFVRIKRPQNSLLDAAGQPVGDAMLTTALSGLDRESYRTMFSLDDETLEQGGESILASRGDLGELLFSASAGLGDLSQQLVRIRTEAEAFYKYRARSGELADLKAELVALKAERDTLDTQASDHARLTAAHAETTARHAEANGERRELRTRLQAVDAVLRALPRVAERNDLQARLEQFDGIPDTPPERADEVVRLREQEARLEASADALEQQLVRLDQELDEIGIDETLLSMRDRFAELETLQARHATAVEDVPKLKLALGESNAEIGQLLIRLGRRDQPDAEDLLLDAATAAALNERISERTTIDARLLAAAKEASDAQNRHQQALASLPEGANPADNSDPEIRQNRLADISRALAKARNEDHGHRLKAAQRELETVRARREALVASLAPWTGEMSELQTMVPLHADQIAARKAELEDHARNTARLDDEIARIEQLLRRLEAERDTISRTTDLPSAEALTLLRARRNEAWEAHKSGPSAVTAEAFETAMADHDSAIERHLAFHADAASLREIALQTATARADLDGAFTARQKLTDQSAAMAEQWGTRIAAMAPTLKTGKTSDLTPGMLEDWLRRLSETLEAQQQLQNLERQIEAARQDQEASCEKLSKALSALGEMITSQDGFDVLLDRAETLISREARLTGLFQAETAARRDLDRRQTELREAETQADAWVLSWKAACEKTWLGDRDQIPTPDSVRESLALLTELGPALKQRASLDDRIAKMERDQADFENAVNALATSAGLDATGMSAPHIAHRLAERFAAAETAKKQHQALTTRREETLEQQRAHAETMAAHQTLKAELLAALDAEDLADAAQKVRQSAERRALRDRLDALDRQICETLNADSIAEALAGLEDADSAALNQEKRDIEADLETLDTDVQELHAARSRAREALDAIGGDDAVARIEQRRRTTLEAIAEGAGNYLRLSAGVLAMEQALTLYREHHRSTMMARASDAIRTISRGAYTSLAAQPDKDRELLIALTADGGSKQASEMSKGARFQLYLALRVAGYHEFAQSRSTVPFIADDIMETFDDFRAEETFRLFAQMAEVGQVIYLTHHRHLCDIARTVCPQLHIHDLTA